MGNGESSEANTLYRGDLQVELPIKSLIAQTPSQNTPTGTASSIIDPALVPLLQTMLWVGFWVFLTIVIRTSRLFNALIRRIEAGSPLRAGYFELGAPPELISPNVQTVTAEGISGLPVSESVTEELMNFKDYSTPIADSIYLIHASEVLTPKTPSIPGRYWVKVWLETYTKEDFNSCQRVTYRLHEDFKHPVVATEAKDKNFELWMETGEEFTVLACVERKEQEPLWLTRYIDLPGRPEE